MVDYRRLPAKNQIFANIAVAMRDASHSGTVILTLFQDKKRNLHRVPYFGDYSAGETRERSWGIGAALAKGTSLKEFEVAYKQVGRDLGTYAAIESDSQAGAGLIDFFTEVVMPFKTGYRDEYRVGRRLVEAELRKVYVGEKATQIDHFFAEADPQDNFDRMLDAAAAKYERRETL